MEPEETQVVRRMTEAWNDRDVDRILALVDPDVEYVNAPNAMEPGTRRGSESVRDVVTKQWEALGPDGHQEIERVHQRGDEVLVEVLLSRGMPASEARIETRGLLSYRVTGGSVTRLEILGAGPEFKDALAAAGLS